MPANTKDSAAPKKGTALGATRDWRGIPVEVYRLPGDGRKWKIKAKNRRQLMMQLVSHADGDGKRIRPTADRLAKDLGEGFSRRNIFYLLDDLQELGFIINKGRAWEKGPRLREANILAAFARRMVAPLLRAEDMKIDPAAMARAWAEQNPESWAEHVKRFPEDAALVAKAGVQD